MIIPFLADHMRYSDGGWCQALGHFMSEGGLNFYDQFELL